MKKNLILVLVMGMITLGCTGKECEPTVKYVEQEFPRLQTLDLNKTIDIPTYTIERDEISVIDDVNVTMSINTFWKSKEGDRKKIDYLFRRLKVFMFGAEILNNQAKDFNKEFLNDKKRDH